jgi:hypothetical protein
LLAPSVVSWCFNNPSETAPVALLSRQIDHMGCAIRTPMAGAMKQFPEILAAKPELRDRLFG